MWFCPSYDAYFWPAKSRYLVYRPYLFTQPQPQLPDFVGSALRESLSLLAPHVSEAEELMIDHWVSFVTDLNPNSGKRLERVCFQNSLLSRFDHWLWRSILGAIFTSKSMNHSVERRVDELHRFGTCCAFALNSAGASGKSGFFIQSQTCHDMPHCAILLPSSSSMISSELFISFIPISMLSLFWPQRAVVIRPIHHIACTFVNIA